MTQLTPNLPEESLKQKLKKIGVRGFWLGLLLSLPTISLQTFILNLFKNAFNQKLMSPEDAITFVKIFWTTAPLTVTAAIIYVGAVQKWIYDSWYVIGAIILGCFWVAIELGLSSVPQNVNVNEYGGTPPGRVISVLNAYFNFFAFAGVP